MNFLAHALLAGPDPGSRVGGMLGDFVKDRLDPAPAELPQTVVAGLVLHRRIDSYADAHLAFQRSRRRVSAERRRVAGIMIDMFYDHFLAVHWSKFSAEPLEDFTANVYRLLAAHETLFPPRFASLFPYMQADDWLSSYRSLDVIGTALDRMAVKRLTRPNTLAGAATELRANYTGFEEDFFAFFPDALRYCATHHAPAN